MCPRDSYPLPRIDQPIDTTNDHHLLIKFMDAYSSYNKIRIVEKDVSHMAFYEDSNIYYYTVIPLGIINKITTYQSMVNKLFAHVIGDTMDAYVDDILMKFKKSVDHEKELDRAFSWMRLHNTQPNPFKCAFGINSVKILAVMLRHKTIKFNQKSSMPLKKWGHSLATRRHDA